MTVHLHIFADRLLAENVETGERYETSAYVHIDEDGQPLRIARLVDGASEPATSGAAGTDRMSNGFGHPRMVVSDFQAADFVFQAAVRAVYSAPRIAWLRQLRVLIQVRRSFPDPLTEVEHRTLVDLARNAGAADVRLIHASRDLPPSALAQLRRG